MFLHYIQNGTVMVGFTYNKEIYYAPLMMILKVRTFLHFLEYFFLQTLNRQESVHAPVIKRNPHF